ncbi:hypothetical protein [Glaciihabitans sp. UYNi722]|uniref:hypothetical protein n=1 Tax=Glaciihabitans sp. UYNi722 TaxID=3156344 RepID=UPI003392E6CC
MSSSIRLEERKPIALWVVFSLAVLYAIASATIAIVRIVQLFISEAVEVSLPVATFWPALKSSVTINVGATANVVAGGFQHAEVSITGLAIDARLWLAAGELLQGVTNTLIGLAIAVLCSRLLKGNPFGPALTRAAIAAAVSVAVGGLAWQLSFRVGGQLASAQVLTVTGWSVDDKDVTADNLSALGWPHPSGGFSVDFWPVWVALVIGAVVIAFRYGDRLQREQTRLVARNRELRRDTDGLV